MVFFSIFCDSDSSHDAGEDAVHRRSSSPSSLLNRWCTSTEPGGEVEKKLDLFTQRTSKSLVFSSILLRHSVSSTMHVSMCWLESVSFISFSPLGERSEPSEFFEVRLFPGARGEEMMFCSFFHIPNRTGVSGGRFLTYWYPWCRRSSKIRFSRCWFVLWCVPPLRAWCVSCRALSTLGGLSDLRRLCHRLALTSQKVSIDLLPFEK